METELRYALCFILPESLGLCNDGGNVIWRIPLHLLPERPSQLVVPCLNETKPQQSLSRQLYFHPSILIVCHQTVGRTVAICMAADNRKGDYCIHTRICPVNIFCIYSMFCK